MRKIAINLIISLLFSTLFLGCATAQGVKQDFEDYTPVVKESYNKSTEWVGEKFNATKEGIKDYFAE